MDSEEARRSNDFLSPGTPLLHGQFVIEKYLNAGGFGVTYLAQDSLDRTVVVKECFPSSMCFRSRADVRARTRANQTDFEHVVQRFGQEARRLAKLTHPNIVGVHDVFEGNGTAYMVLDYVEGRDLLDVIEDAPELLPPPEVRRITLALLDAIGHVHAQGILHRDIAPDNILLDEDGEPVLIDFGAARDTAQRVSRVLSAIHVVKDGYSPQEFYLGGSDQTPASDLYSLAATLHHLLTGAPPIHSHIRLAALADQKPDPYVPLVGRIAGYDAGFLAAIDKTLSLFAKDRLPSAEAWIDAIETGAYGAPAPAADVSIGAEGLQKLIEETNCVVREEQERARMAAADEARRRAEEAQQAEDARQRRLEIARRDAEEAGLTVAAEQAPEPEGSFDAPAPAVRRPWYLRLFGLAAPRSRADRMPT